MEQASLLPRRSASVFGDLDGEIDLGGRRLEESETLWLRTRGASWKKIHVDHIVGVGRVIVDVDMLRLLLSEQPGGDLASTQLDGAQTLLGAPIQPLAESEVHRRTALYGTNRIPVPLDGWPTLFAKVVATPFFIFQLASVLLWVLEDYCFYAATILLTSLFSAATEARQIHQNSSRMVALADYSLGHHVHVLRKKGRCAVPVDQLVPGDLVEIEQGCPVPADLLLLPSQDNNIHYRLLVNESSLTGESTPTTKRPCRLTQSPSGAFWAPSQESLGTAMDALQSQILAGTEVITMPSRLVVIGLVLRTRASTRRGTLIRRIILGQGESAIPQLDRDAYAATMLLLVSGLLAIVLVLPRLVGVFRMTWPSATLDALDLITIAVPPALPATVTFGLVFAISRLHDKNIRCLQPVAVAKAAWIQTMCFDKTGTITEDGLVARVLDLPSLQSGRRTLVKHNPRFPPDLPLPVAQVMAACHELVLLSNGSMFGDPADAVLFGWSNWKLHSKDPNTDHYTLRHYQQLLEILHVYEFRPELARMTVVAVDHNGRKHVLCKGSPETIAPRSQGDSLPANFAQLVASYAEQGLRVLALARKSLGQHEGVNFATDREALETGLEFLGLAVFENKLRPRTKEAVEVLRNSAGLRCVMATGDRLDTAESVAKHSGIITSADGCIWQGLLHADQSQVEFLGPGDQKMQDFEMIEWLAQRPQITLTLSGTAFQHVRRVYGDTDLALVLDNCRVFARMLPEDKTDLVKCLSALRGSNTVGMCGDGANDMGALREASVGISLCDTASSDATAALAAGLSTDRRTIYTVVDAIAEGRAASAASVAAFQFMFTYSIVQLSSVVVLYLLGNTYGDGQFLFVDLFLVIPVGIMMGRSAAAKELTVEKPPMRLVDGRVLVVTIGQSAVMILFQLIAVFSLGSVRLEEHAVAGIEENDHLITRSRENSVMFLLCNFQYLWACFAFNHGPPFRARGTSNLALVGTSALLMVGCVCLLGTNGGDMIGRWLELAAVGSERWALVALVLGNLGISVLWASWARKYTRPSETSKT